MSCIKLDIDEKLIGEQRETLEKDLLALGDSKKVNRTGKTSQETIVYYMPKESKSIHIDQTVNTKFGYL